MEPGSTVKEYIGSTLRITIDSGAPLINAELSEGVQIDSLPNCKRMVEGTLIAIDNDPNILLDEVEEYIYDAASREIHSKRALGLVSVPCQSILKIEVSKREYQMITNPKQFTAAKSLAGLVSKK